MCRRTEQLRVEGISIIDIRRLTRRYTGKPTQVVKIRCTEDSAKQLLDTRVVVKNKVCLVEKQRLVRVVRCYNCQRLGHLAFIVITLDVVKSVLSRMLHTRSVLVSWFVVIAVATILLLVPYVQCT